MTAEEENSRKLGLILAAVMLGVVAVALMAAILGRDWLREKFAAPPPAPMTNAEKYALKHLQFPGMTPAQRDAFDVGILHDDALREWWYINAHLYDEKDRRYTLMIAMLKDGRLFGILAEHTLQTTVPISMPETTAAHDAFGRVYAIGPATIRQPDPALLCYDFEFVDEDLKLNLNVCANKAPLIVNGNGEVQMGEKGHSWYYSITNANISGTGSLKGEELRLVGRAWMDRQWGNWFVEDFDRWDWYSLQLDGDIELLLFVFWKDGRIIHQFGDVYLANGDMKHELKFATSATATWRSPRTGIAWETGWTVQIPQYRARLVIRADFPDHEVDDALWEGGVDISGRWANAPVTGRGFFEARRRGVEEKR